MKESIYLAGGCFWGLEAYFKLIDGVIETEVGFSGGKSKKPGYHDVVDGTTGHAETTKVVFDPEKITLAEILKHFWRVHSPTSLNKQGNDIGTQYRSAIFYSNDRQKEIIEQSKAQAQEKYDKPIVTEIAQFDEFFPAEEYHQDYLDKNPNGYCHIDLEMAKTPLQ